VIYQLVARNQGTGIANNILVVLPFTPGVQAIETVTFSSPNAWVSAILTNAIELRPGLLHRDETVTATLRLRTAPASQLGTLLATRAQLQSSHDSEPRFSNRVSLAVSTADASASTVPLKITPSSGPPATSFDITYDGFASNERVSLWYHPLEGAVVSLGEIHADAQGIATLRFPATRFASGRYQLVAYGQCSQVSAVGAFTVTTSR
jgi:hypothetical protein